MNQDHANILTESAMEVLEMIAYLCPLPVTEETGSNGLDSKGKSNCIGITFQGPVSGKLFITLPDLLSRIIAANMLGIDENDPELQQKSIDATKELLNIICGNVLPKLYGEKVLFRLGSPYLIENVESEITENNYSNIQIARLMVDEHLVTCIMVVNEDFI